MSRLNILRQVLKSMSVIAFCMFGVGNVAAEPGCRSGGVALANAYIHANAMYALIFGDLDSYVSRNRAHFRAGSDAVRCAAALSRAFLSSALQLYDPADIQRKQMIDAQLGSMGISPGQSQPSASSMLYGMSMQLSRLARSLPAAAYGDYGPWNTPTNEIEQMQFAAETMLAQFLQDPTVRAAFAAQEQLIRQGAELEFRIMLTATQRLANAK